MLATTRTLAAAILCTVAPAARGQTFDLVYVLQPQGIPTAVLAGTGADWLVIEPAKDGSWAETMFKKSEVNSLRTAGLCKTRVLAYLSIGEAEDYRDYWDPQWVDQAGDPIPGVAPSWLGPTNPDWEGNYKVRYWDPEWQQIIVGIGKGTTPIERIAAQGFSGVYLDIVDAYQFWSEDLPEHSHMQARTEMVDFIAALAARARAINPNFLVFPQNASDIIRDDHGELDATSERFFSIINGIGIEDLYYDELQPAIPADTAYRLAQLAEYSARGKTVLVTDYVLDQNTPTPANNEARVADFMSRCRAAGFVPYAAHADRSLDEIVTIIGPGWSIHQPEPGCGRIVH